MNTYSTNHIPMHVHVYANADSRRVYLDAVELHPAYSQKIHNHSPDGFSWGYMGSGCAQLALAILLQYTSIEVATLTYQMFKEKFVATWNMNSNVDTTLNLQSIVSDLLVEAQMQYSF